MKKIILYTIITSFAFIIINCSSKKKVTETSAVLETPQAPKKMQGFKETVLVVIKNSCSPCHIAGKGNKEAYDVLSNTKNRIDEIIKRVELMPDQRGFMPKNGTKLTSEAVAVLKQWKADGFPE
jgi:uncharacterized membrane protein